MSSWVRVPGRIVAGVLAVSFILASPAFSKDRLEISDEMLTPDTDLTTFRVSEVFKALLATYREEIAAVKADAKLSDADKAVRIERLKKQATELLLLHEKVVNISPVAVAVNILWGGEVPFGFTTKLLKYGYLSASFGGGLTIAATRARGTGKLGFVVGASILGGPSMTLGKPPVNESERQAGYMDYFGVAVIVPLVESIPTMKAGDLQGWYFGGSGEFSRNPGGVVTPHTISVGVYARPNNYHFPRAGMIMVSRSAGFVGKGLSLQGEALYYGTLAGSDGSSIRSPLPFIWNNRTSEHADGPRLEEMKKQVPTPDDIHEAMKRIGDKLESNTP